MKFNIKNLKGKTLSFFSNLKNKVVPLIVKNKIILIVVIILLVVILGGIIGSYRSKKTHAITGNLNNLGFTTNLKGWVYYLGYNNGNIDGIYRVKNNKKEKISDDYGYYLNNDGKYIYYVDTKTDDLIRMKKNGENKTIFEKKVDSEKVTILNNWMYYLKNKKLYRVKTDGNKKQEILKKSMEHYEIVGNWIYYSYYSDGKYIIAKMKTNGKDTTRINLEAGKVFFINNNKIYYITEQYDEKETKIVHSLYRINLNGKNKQKITDIEGDINLNSINFYKNYLYYTKLDEDNELAIYKMKLNGKKETKIIDVKAYSTLINLNGKYIYYPDENDEGSMQLFRIKTNKKQKEKLSL